MNRLPKASLAIVEKHKITEYLLSASHPYGRAKAAFFQSCGFQIDAWQELQAALLKHAQENAVTSSAETPFGKKYIIDGPLFTKDGRNPIVRTIWFIEAGEEQPRFVTAYPLKGKRS
jgi:hypothetical protein